MSGNNFSYSAETLKNNISSTYGNTHWWANIDNYGAYQNSTAQHIIPRTSFYNTKLLDGVCNVCDTHGTIQA